MRTPQFDITPFLRQDEGQHFDRKSLFEGPEGKKRARNHRDIRDQVARYVAAFANAEGGVLVLGVEDDATLSGHELPQDALESILRAPMNRLTPPCPSGFVVKVDDIELLVFDVPASDIPVKVNGDGFPLRVGDSTIEASESQIRALKFQGLAESWESRPSSVTLRELDCELLMRARQRAGLAQWSDGEYLLKRKLADQQGNAIRLRRAAELLFTRNGPEHPNAGVRVFRVIGTERHTGPEHNVEELPRIEGNLPFVVDEAGKVIGGLLRRPSRLVGARFQPVSEYPEFSWKEALLNAIAHRDYSIEGACTEVWLFEDRMEIVSPGALPGNLTLEELLTLRRVHHSRNPRLMRALVDLGAARDQGEGIPRMFAEMMDAFLPKPEITVNAQSLIVTLRNTPTFSTEDRTFISSLGSLELSSEEFRALLHAHRHGRVENAHLRQFAGIDTLGASQVLRRLRDRGLLELHPAGANSYYTLPSSLSVPINEHSSDRVEHSSNRVEHSPDRVEQNSDRVEQNSDRVEQSSDRVEHSPDRVEHSPAQGEQILDRSESIAHPISSVDTLTLTPQQERAIAELGNRPRKERIREVIEEICASQWTKPTALAQVLDFSVRKLTERHLSPMVEAGRLKRRYPDQPTHSQQAYLTVHWQGELPLIGDTKSDKT